MDDPESHESLLESHYEQQTTDDDPMTRTSHPLERNRPQVLEPFVANTNGQQDFAPDSHDASLILEPDQQEDEISRIPDVETRVNSGPSSRGTRGGDKPPSNSMLQFDDAYLKSVDGVLKLIQIIMTLTSLICVVSAGNGEGGYLNLPVSWHLKIFIFTLVASFLMSVVILFLHTSSLIRTLAALKWPLVELVIYSGLTLLLLIGASIVASTVHYYQDPKVKVTTWTINQLLSAVVLGYGAMVLYAATAGLGYFRWRRETQMYYGRYRLQNARSDSADALA